MAKGSISFLKKRNKKLLFLAPSTNGMTANVHLFDMSLLTRVASQIVNEVCVLNRVVFNVASKPSATIEWA